MSAMRAAACRFACALAALGFMLAASREMRAAGVGQVELQSGWRLASAAQVGGEDSAVSLPGFDVTRWHAAQHMPATVLQILQEDGVYPNLYFGMNLTSPGDLWKQDWWYRTTFDAPAGRQAYTLVFEGINYRADVWLNGHRIADRNQVVGMYNKFELDATQFIRPGAANVLAVKVVPERGLLTEDGEVVGGHPVELADSWLDWINWKFIGYHDPQGRLNIPFVPDRNAGIWKRVFLRSTGPVSLGNAYVAASLPLPALAPASLTVYCDAQNHGSQPVTGALVGEITRAGKPAVQFRKTVSLLAGQTAEVAVGPGENSALAIASPDLWWPYPMGPPNLYHLALRFEIDGAASDAQDIDFGIRQVTQRRDRDDSFPQIGRGGNFYLQINGRDYLVRGAAYTPDLLFRRDPARDAAIMMYVKDLGLNLVRWELKIADDTMLDRADREGVPVMLGWMCCMQWEHWDRWSAEDQWVARASLRARLRELRSHAAVVLWANGSDGLPPDPVLNDYHQIERELHWQNPVVDTVSEKNRAWSGIHMVGPYVWRPPYYWFSDAYGPARGSSAEEGDNETVLPLESLKKFIPADKLWPPNDYWFFHAGGNEGGNSTLANIRRAVDARYGPSRTADEFTRKAQLAHYEDVRAQYETYATHWSNRKMVMHWMMDTPWPSFFGHLFDYYFKQGGGYFGAKKGLRPLSVVWDYYATGDRSTAHVYAVNLRDQPLRGAAVTVDYYNLDGSLRFTRQAKGVDLDAFTSAEVLALPRVPGLSSTYFVRCRLTASSGAPLLAENAYWQSTTEDDLGGSANDDQFTTRLLRWADLTALNSMARVPLKVSVAPNQASGPATVTLRNDSGHIAFFVRIELTRGVDGNEILPITYDDNYITLFPHTSATVSARFDPALLGAEPAALRLEGVNVSRQVLNPAQSGR
jgi:exo-1,4-beta-D-glucosaminidase